MSAISFEAWENIISSHLNGVPLPALVDAVRSACIDFCNRSKVWNESVGGVSYDPATINIQVPIVDSGSFPNSVVQVWVSGKEVHAASRPMLDGKYDSWLAERGDAAYFICTRPDVLRLVPAPNVAIVSDIVLSVAYQPSRNSLVVPVFLYEMYADAIGYKAIAILHGHEDAAYANPGKIGEFEARYAEGLAWATNSAGAGFNRARLQSGLNAI